MISAQKENDMQNRDMEVTIIDKKDDHAQKDTGAESKSTTSKTVALSDDQATQIVKRKRNRPDLQKFGEENTLPGDNARYLRYAMVSLDLPPIDIADEHQVENRIREYFFFCIENDRKPNMVGMANWLGIDKSTLDSWKRGEYRADTHSHVIRKACQLLEEQWVDYMQNGKANPASLIFLGKNMFGYKDVQDVVVTPNTPMGAELPESELRTVWSLTERPQKHNTFTPGRSSFCQGYII